MDIVIPIRFPDVPGLVDRQIDGSEMPNTLHLTYHDTAPRESRGCEQEEVPQGTRRDEVGADSGTSGHREGGIDPRIRATTVQRPATGVARREDRTGLPARG